MTFKEIWVDFVEKTKEQGIAFVEGVKMVCSSSFDILKNTVVGLFTGIYDWLVAVVTGFGKAIWALISFVFSAFGVAIFTTLKLCLDKLTEWAMKW